MTTPTPRPTDLDSGVGLLTLVQWLSPAYPLGAFAFSHGLEAAVRAGQIADESGLADWLDALLTDGSGRTDAILLRRAHDAADAEALAWIDAEARALQPSAERLRESERQGAAFTAATGEIWALPLGDWLLPVAVGGAARLMALDPQATTVLYLHSFASNLCAVAQRLMPLGQTGAQRVLAGLAPAIDATASRAATDQALWSNAIASDIAAMRHETLQPRIFQS